jgi:hypothetical protein
VRASQEVDQLRKHRADLETAAAAMVEALAARGGGSGGGTALEEPAMALTDACTALGACMPAQRAGGVAGVARPQCVGVSKQARASAVVF